ncbi:MAG: hypothetical protein ACK5JH_11275 [Anaerocolumna sp.]
MRYFVTVNDIKSILNIDNAPAVDFLCNDKQVHVDLARQKTGFGYKVFMVCPRCGSHRSELYMYRDNLICRDCYPVRVYKTRQDSTDGGYEEITYRMNRLAARYGIHIKQPFDYYQLINKKPKNMHQRTWERIIRQLQLLANMRFQALFFKTKYSPKAIRYALSHCLYLFSLYDMGKYVIDWQRCIDIVNGNSNPTFPNP